MPPSSTTHLACHILPMLASRPAKKRPWLAMLGFMLPATNAQNVRGNYMLPEPHPIKLLYMPQGAVPDMLLSAPNP